MSNKIIRKYAIIIAYCTLLCAISCTSKNTAQKESYAPTISGTISNQKVNCFAQDANGYIWMGTFHGLNRYNNYEFEQYFRSESEVSLQDSQIQDLLLDSKDRMWIATVNGISLYNEQGNFTRIETPEANRNIIKLMEDKNGNILYSARNIIGKFDETDGRFHILPISVPNFFALNTHIDAQNRLWGVEFNRLSAFNVETGELIAHFDIPFQTLYSYLYDNHLILAGKGNIAIFDVNKMEFTPVPKNLAKNQKLMESQITLMGQLKENKLLINTDGHGLFCYDIVTGALQHQNDSDFPFNISKQNIISFFTDSNGNLWIGTEDQGFIAKYKYDNRFQEHINLKTSLDGKSVTAMASDGERIWISTSADGFYVYDINSRMLYPQGNLSLEQDGVKFSAKEMISGDDGTIWAAITNLNQIINCKWQNGKAQIIGRYFTMSPLSIAKGSDGSIWTGTISNTLSVLRPGEKKFHYIKVFGDNYTFIPALLPIEDGGIIVAGMMNPLVIVYPDGTITKLPIDDEEFKSCIKYVEFVPTALAKDKKGNLWIGTISNGLLKYDTKLNKLTSLTDAIEVSDISSIIEDAYGYIWVSTIYGLFRLEPESMEVRSFYQYNGIGGNQFNERAVCIIDQDRIVFGGTHGISMMNLALQQEKHRVPICFDNLHIHNRLITANDYPEVMDKALSQNPVINLRHDQNSFSISFSALEYGAFNKVDYFYKMEGVDNYWIDAHNNREAYYSNIPAGKHTFSVRISSNDSSIAENENSIIIKVKPAPWKSWWAYLIYILLIVGIISAATKAINDLHLAKLKASIAEDERQREMEITTMVKRFFANISHEFRTPLTMISAPVSQLYGDNTLPREKRELVTTIKRNSDRMLYLVEQIMDLGKIDNDVMRLEVCKKNISDVIARRIALFTLYAGEKRIKLQQRGLHAPIWLWVDEDKIDKIFCNLISNALKYTSMGGNICIELNILNGEESFVSFPDGGINKKLHYAVISVSNTGPIITDNEKEHIFERFYQIKNDSNVNYGTGIGLYYVKKLTLMHHGAIKVDNLEDNSGVKFSFAIPVEDNAYSEKERISTETTQTTIASETNSLEEDTIIEETDLPETESINRATLIVVDDDAEILKYLKSLLIPHYNVHTFFDAVEALAAIEEIAPDLIISDVLMPGTDGYSFCRSIKEDSQICHIPVLLLTAKRSVEDQVDGLESGADAYITKPFEPSYLLALIKSQLRNRERIRTLIGNATQMSSLEEEKNLSQHDKHFMSELYGIMDQYLADPEVDISLFTDALHISRSKFFYKLKGLTGMSPALFFKTYKLNRAAELLSEEGYSISEIADMTGFSSLSHFSRSFKKQFGKNPSEWNSTKKETV